MNETGRVVEKGLAVSILTISKCRIFSFGGACTDIGIGSLLVNVFAIDNNLAVKTAERRGNRSKE
jgi:hypothetical protein